MSAAVDESVQASSKLGELRRSRLADARLYLVCDRRTRQGDLERFLHSVLAAGVDVVQLRDKQASESELLAVAPVFRRQCDLNEALFIVNDRVDLVAACRADGVHLGQDDMPVAAARAALGDNYVIGCSTHSADQIRAARAPSCDYIGVGPVFATPTKPEYAPVGIELVAAASDQLAADLPFFAIGGIDAASIDLVLGAGASRVAVVRAVAEAADPARAAKALSVALQRAV